MGCHEKFYYIRTRDVRKHYYGVVIRKLLYTWRDQTRGNVVAREWGSWGGDRAAIRGLKYGWQKGASR